MSDRARLAVDVGGTFTDVALAVDGAVHTAKILTNPREPVEGAMEAIDVALASASIGPEGVGTIIHGTTLATNALIERTGCRVAAVLTHGFRDILEIGYERRYDQYDVSLEKPNLLVPPERCYTVGERLDALGNVVAPLDEESVNRLVDSLRDAAVEAVAVCFLHSYRNGRHESQVRELLSDRLPEVAVSLSSEISPEIREYDRLCTTIANAYITPLMSRYLDALRRALTDGSFEGPLLIMNSGGSMTTVESAMRFPVRLVESGPSGGAILASRIAVECGLENVLSFDMGGTTAKICLVDGGQPQTTREFEVARAARFIRGSGLPLRVPVIEMIEIGAGGGSVASVDRMGLINVGPRSAGSEPGPASYNRGGHEATVTDADLAVGLIDPMLFAEGRIELSGDRAADALTTDIADPLGIPMEAAASGVCQVVDENMANAARVHAMERGASCGERTMIAFGGNGPLHAVRLATKLGVKRIVVPVNPGVGSAVGFLHAPVAYETVRSFTALLGGLDLRAVNELYTTMEQEAEEVVRDAAGDVPLNVRRTAFMRYKGQGHEILVRVANGVLDDAALAELRSAYELEYARQYSRHVPDMEIEVLNWAVSVSSPQDDFAVIGPVEVEQRPEPSGTRSMYDARSEERLVAPSYHRADLQPGDFIPGPAVVTEPQTTTVVSKDFDLRVDSVGHLIMTRRTA